MIIDNLRYQFGIGLLVDIEIEDDGERSIFPYLKTFGLTITYDNISYRVKKIFSDNSKSYVFLLEEPGSPFKGPAHRVLEVSQDGTGTLQ